MRIGFFEEGAQPLFLCDVMLARFARYLRAAGYDTELADNQASDRDIVRQANDQGRWLLTLDRRIGEHKAARGRVVMLTHGTLDQQARMLAQCFAMDWTGHAFSRCLLDNALLRPATEAECETVPADARRAGEPLLVCPVCRRAYWRGSHYRRMMSRLQCWQQRILFSGSVAGPR